MFNSNILFGARRTSLFALIAVTICGPAVSFFPNSTQAKTCEILFEEVSATESPLESKSVGEQLSELVAKIDKHYRLTGQTMANGSPRRSIEELAELGLNGRTEIQFESGGQKFVVGGHLTHGFGPYLEVDQVAADGSRKTVQIINSSAPYNPSFTDVLQISAANHGGSRFIGVRTEVYNSAKELVFFDLRDIRQTARLNPSDFAANGLAVVRIAGTEMIVQKREAFSRGQTQAANRRDALRRVINDRLRRNENQISIEYFAFDSVSGYVRRIRGAHDYRTPTMDDYRSNLIERP